MESFPEIFNICPKSAPFVKLDDSKGFNQMLTRKESRDLCSFFWEGRRFIYRASNFGEPKNPACYQRMNMVATTLMRLLGYAVTTYVDDSFVVIDESKLDSDNQVKWPPKRWRNF